MTGVVWWMSTPRPGPNGSDPAVEARRSSGPLSSAGAPGLARRSLERPEEAVVAQVRATLAGFDPEASEGPKRFADAVFGLRDAPQMAPGFVEVAADPTAPIRVREAAADVLAQEGSAGSQQALRALLDREDLRGDEAELWLLQRVGLLTAPTHETATWVAARMETAVGEEAAALAFTAGAVAGRPTVSEEDRAALDGALQQAMAASDPRVRAAATAGWGNRHRDDGLSTLVAMAGDADPRVREAAVWGVRHLPGTGADGVVVLGAEDPAWTVQRVALKVAATREPSDVLGTAVAMAAEGDVDPRWADELTHAIERQLVGAPRDAALRAVLVQAVDSPSLRARIRGMLAAP